ncbi:MAG: holo-ACP synthase [Holophagales bacterium]|nr:holo-ACP synthase [Holophagales bacterium]
MTTDVSLRAALLAAAYPDGGHVLGLGIDLCEIDRVEEALRRHGRRFLDRICAPGELRRPYESRRIGEHVAGLFAAKEAAMKALGTGMQGVSFREIAVAREPAGPPRLVLTGRARARADALGVIAAHVTITHGRREAVSVVLLLGAR